MDIGSLKTELKAAMTKGIESFKGQLSKVRTGRANPALLDGLTANYYGTPTPLKQLGQVSTPEARMLQIQPFDKSSIPEIEKAIMASNLGVTPSNDGNIIRIPFPALTEEKRKDLVKQVKKLGEEAKVVLRNTRRDFNEKIKKEEKGKTISEDESKKYQNEVQEITDSFTKQIDQLVEVKEKELTTI